MAWIKVIPPEEATGELKEMYDEIIADGESNNSINYNEDGTVEMDNILTIHSLHPATLRAHLFMYEELMHGENNLSKKQREMIGVAVSAVNDCEY